MLTSKALVRAFSATEPLPVIESPSYDGRKERSDGIAYRYGVAVDRVTIVFLLATHQKHPIRAVRRISAIATMDYARFICPSKASERSFLINTPTIEKGTAKSGAFLYGGGGKARTYDLMHVKQDRHKI